MVDTTRLCSRRRIHAPGQLKPVHSILPLATCNRKLLDPRSPHNRTRRAPNLPAHQKSLTQPAYSSPPFPHSGWEPETEASSTRTDPFADLRATAPALARTIHRALLSRL